MRCNWVSSGFWPNGACANNCDWMHRNKSIQQHDGDTGFVTLYALNKTWNMRAVLSLHWRRNDHDGVSNHQPPGCLLNRFFSDADQRKHQSSASLAFVWGIHRDRWIPRTKGQLRGKCFHLMTSSCFCVLLWFGTCHIYPNPHGLLQWNTFVLNDLLLHNSAVNSPWYSHTKSKLFEITKALGSMSIRYRSDTKVSDRYLIDVDLRVFTIWVMESW